MQKRALVVSLALTGLCGFAVVSAAAHEVKLPPGPIADRHDLMEGIGKSSKVINDAMKSGNFAPVGDAAEKIQAAAAKVTALFPPGSTHANSRAKPEIWTQRAQFEGNVSALAESFQKLSDIATTGNMQGFKTQFATVINACFACHGGAAKSGGSFRAEIP